MLNSKYLADKCRLQTKWREKKTRKEHQSCLKWRCLRHPWAGTTAGGGSCTAAPSSRDLQRKKKATLWNGIYPRRKSQQSRENRQEQRRCLQAQPQVEPRVREAEESKTRELDSNLAVMPPLQSDRNVAETAGDWRLRSRFPSKVWTLLGQAELMGSGGPQHFQHRGELMSKRTPGFSSCEYREENEVRPSYINPTVTDK